MSQQPLIELRNVSVTYDGNVHAIEAVTLTVEEGELLGLLGPNGGGKTTLIKVILGLTGNCCGTVTVIGETLCHSERHGPIRSPTRHSGMIGYLPQDVLSQAKGFPATVREVVSTGRISRGSIFHRFKAQDKLEVEEAMRLTDIYDLRNRRISELSGGQLQRVFIARALASKPRLLILDEPTGGVDTVAQAKFYNILERLNVERGITIILSSHDITAVSQLATKVACINRTLYYHGEPQDAFWSEVLPKAYGYPVRFVAHNHAV